MNRKEALEKMLDYVKDGTGVLTAGEIHPDIPTIHDVGHRKGQRLQTDGEVVHMGFGYFRAKVGDDNVVFDGGGAMRRVDDGEEKWVFSWCPFTGPILETGYDLTAVEKALNDLLAL